VGRTDVNLTDIAKRAGVSIATASRALNDAYGVAPATRQRVLAAAEEMAYVVSPEASRLARGSTGRIGLVVPHIDRWFFGTMVAALESVLAPAGLDLLLYDVGGEEDRRGFFHRLPARRKVDALVVVGFPVAEAERQRLELMGVAVVSAGGQAEAYPYVCIDDEQAGRQAVDHLLHLGHRRIGMIEAVDPDQPGWPEAPGRSAAYTAAHREACVPIHPELVVTVDWGGESGAEGMARLLSLRRPPTAVYAHSDEVALGALRTIRRAGLRVPEDLSVIGIDDHPLAALVDLSTVRQPVHDQGVAAGHMLLALLAGEEVDRAVTLPTRLVPRGTTGRRRADGS
jgi:LacI family transcriptional regulator, repressor for deo operon, udp, cdd, tsx, nupC, and nupG